MTSQRQWSPKYSFSPTTACWCGIQGDNSFSDYHTLQDDSKQLEIWAKRPGWLNVKNLRSKYYIACRPRTITCTFSYFLDNTTLHWQKVPTRPIPAEESCSSKTSISSAANTFATSQRRQTAYLASFAGFLRHCPVFCKFTQCLPGSCSPRYGVHRVNLGPGLETGLREDELHLLIQHKACS